MEHFMVVRSGSDKLHFGAVIWTMEDAAGIKDGFSVYQEDGHFIVKGDALIPSSLVCIRVTSDNHEMPNTDFLFCD